MCSVYGDRVSIRTGYTVCTLLQSTLGTLGTSYSTVFRTIPLPLPYSVHTTEYSLLVLVLPALTPKRRRAVLRSEYGTRYGVQEYPMEHCTANEYCVLRTVLRTPYRKLTVHMAGTVWVPRSLESATTTTTQYAVLRTATTASHCCQPRQPRQPRPRTCLLTSSASPSPSPFVIFRTIFITTTHGDVI